eukprot:gene31361-40747_t
MGRPSQSACPVLWVGKVTVTDINKDHHRQPRNSFFVDSSHALRASMHANQSASISQQLPINTTSTRADNPLSNGPVVITADEKRQHTQSGIPLRSGGGRQRSGSDDAAPYADHSAGIILGLKMLSSMTERQMLKAGAGGFLVKPLDMELLRQILQDLSAK